MSQFVFLHVSYQQTRLLLHRLALDTPASKINSPASISAMPLTFASSAKGVALDAATKIAEIIQASQERGVMVTAIFTGYCAFDASLVHLVRMFDPRKKVQLESKKNMETCLKFLLHLRQYWGLFNSITDNLKKLYRRFSECYARGEPLPSHLETSRLLQYSDWFLRFPQSATPPEPEDQFQQGQGRAQPGEDPHPDDGALSRGPDWQTLADFFARLGPARQTPPVVGGGRVPLKQLPPQQGFMQSPGSAGTGHTPSPVGVRGAPGTTRGINTPSPNMHAGSLEQARKLDTPRIPTSSPSPYAGFAQTQTQRGTPAAAVVGRIPAAAAAPATITTPVSASITVSAQQFSTPEYPPQTPSAAAPPTFPHPNPHPPPFLYDSYPGGTDSTLIAALSSGGLWPDEENVDVPAFPDQNAGGWFTPFSAPEFGSDGGVRRPSR